MPDVPIFAPSIGRIVHFILHDYHVAQINRRRADATAKMDWHRQEKTGAQVHIGNSVSVGQVFPMIITRVWGNHPGSAVNGQVLLDGNDTLWVTSVVEGDKEGQWFVPPRV